MSPNSITANRRKRRHSGLLHRIFGLAGLATSLFLTISCTAHNIAANDTDPDTNSFILYSGTEAAKNALCLPKECLRFAIELKERGESAQSIERLYELRRTWPGTIEAARGALLLALFKIESDRLKLERGKGEDPRTLNPPALNPIDALDIDAIELLKEAKILTGISDYIDLYTARAYSAGNETGRALKIVETRLKMGSDTALSPVLKPLFLYERAGLNNRLGHDYTERASLIRLIDEHPAHRLLPDSLLRAAKLSWALSDPASLYTFATRLRTDHPASPEAEEAVRVLKWLDTAGTALQAGTTLSAPSALTTGKRYARALNLYKAAMYTETLEELNTLINVVKQNEQNTEPDRVKTELYSDAVLLHALTLFRMKRYTATMDLLNQQLGELTQEKRPDALYWIALSALRTKRADLMSEALGRLDSTPERKERAWALLFSGRLYEKLGDYKRSGKFFETIIQDYNSRPAMHATWHIAWRSYMDGDYIESRRVLDKYLESTETGPNGKAGFYTRDRDKFIYWSARSAQRLGKTEEATLGFTTLCAPRNDTYYCQMATERLGDIGIQTTSRPVIAASAAPGSTEASDRLNTYRGYRAARELIALGLNTEAAEELDILAKQLNKNPYRAEQIKEVAALFYDAGDYYRGLKLYSKFYRFGNGSDQEREKRLPTTAKSAFSAYPMGVVDSVARITGSREWSKRKRVVNTDPLLVAAIMREESTFNPAAVSHSGALGLMQIMPKTGDFIAMKLLAQAPERAELIDPATNIRYGAWYLGYLARRFNQNVTLTIAGYNAGPGAAARWSKDKRLKRLSIDEFIESIPYTETRRYTKRVLRSYTAYLAAAGIDITTRFSRPLILSPATLKEVKERAEKQKRGAG